MKLNNKGFAITAVLYGLLILFVVLTSSYLLVLSAKKDRVEKLAEEIESSYVPPLSLGDYVKYTPAKNTYSTDPTMTGYSSSQTIYPNELNTWRVLRINNDKTIDIISEYVSSTEVYFANLTGYKNLVGYLNVLASQYETPGITVGSRHFGYAGQTEYITYIDIYEPWSCSTGDSGCDTVEEEGGGDELFYVDFDQVYDVLGTRVAYKVGTTQPIKYWIASRLYLYGADGYFMDRYIDEYGDNYDSHLSDEHEHWYSLRPIVTLKSGLRYAGEGTSTNPWQIEI